MQTLSPPSQPNGQDSHMIGTVRAKISDELKQMRVHTLKKLEALSKPWLSKMTDHQTDVVHKYTQRAEMDMNLSNHHHLVFLYQCVPNGNWDINKTEKINKFCKKTMNFQLHIVGREWQEVKLLICEDHKAIYCIKKCMKASYAMTKEPSTQKEFQEEISFKNSDLQNQFTTAYGIVNEKVKDVEELKWALSSLQIINKKYEHVLTELSSISSRKYDQSKMMIRWTNYIDKANKDFSGLFDDLFMLIFQLTEPDSQPATEEWKHVLLLIINNLLTGWQDALWNVHSDASKGNVKNKWE